jgi:hypothetical protein
LKKEDIIKCYPDDIFLFADGLDKAILGVDQETMRVIYSVKKCINCLMRNSLMDYQEAIEFFDFNTRGAYVGEKTPIWCEDL